MNMTFKDNIHIGIGPGFLDHPLPWPDAGILAVLVP